MPCSDSAMPSDHHKLSESGRSGGMPNAGVGYFKDQPCFSLSLMQERLPRELWLVMAEYLDVETLAEMRRVSRRFKVLYDIACMSMLPKHIIACRIQVSGLEMRAQAELRALDLTITNLSALPALRDLDELRRFSKPPEIVIPIALMLVAISPFNDSRQHLWKPSKKGPCFKSESTALHLWASAHSIMNQHAFKRWFSCLLAAPLSFVDTIHIMYLAEMLALWSQQTETHVLNEVNMSHTKQSAARPLTPASRRRNSSSIVPTNSSASFSAVSSPTISLLNAYWTSIAKLSPDSPHSASLTSTKHCQKFAASSPPTLASALSFMPVSATAAGRLERVCPAASRVLHFLLSICAMRIRVVPVEAEILRLGHASGLAEQVLKCLCEKELGQRS